jgi:hypothetical protein
MIGGLPSLVAVFFGFSVAVAAFFYCAAQEEPPKRVTTNQMLMRDKLTYASKALEGLSLEDFDKIAEAGNMMGIISRAAAWHIIPTDQYVRMSKNFQEQARDLERHAKEKNLDAASMDYMRITLTCVQCHNYMRENRAAKKD